MIRFIIRRLLAVPFVLIGLSIMIFAMLMLLNPIERATLYVTSPPRTPDAMQAIIEKYGLDQPIYVQFAHWFEGVLHGNLGYSTTANMPVTKAIATYFPATLELVIWSAVPIVVVGIWLGIQAAVHKDTVVDHSARMFSIIGYSFPTFVFGLLVLMLFYARLQWFPPGRLSDWADSIVHSSAFINYTGMHSFDALLNLRFDIFTNSMRHLILPVLTLAYVDWALILRVTRSSMLEVINQDYIRTARSKGLSERLVINTHARPNAMIPVVTIGGLLLIGLLNGVVITETVFNYHGMGYFLAAAALRFDAISVLGVTIFDGAILVFGNLIMDVLYSFLDPRIRLE
jgi:ABC-type dipeptide/oligopeptide/nickel transport system permease component